LPNDILETVEIEIAYLVAQRPLGIFTWAMQEKTKGRATFDGVLGSTHGGWKFNDWSYGTNSIQNPTAWWHMSPSSAALLPDSQLRTNAFFDFTTSPSNAADLVLEGPGGSGYAQTNRNRIIADAIPALTLPAGANPVPKFSPQGQPTRNFNMQDEFK